MSVDHDISVLNSLIQTTLDSMKGFEEAAKEAQSTRFAQMFADFARERSQVATLLQAEVRQLGGDPEDDSSFLAAAHRRLLDLRNLLTGSDDRAVIKEVERGEDYIKAKFDTALEDAELQPRTLQVIREAYTSVRAGHDRASALKHSMN